ncbi:MAG: helix-turn-helix domain-containing protein [Egibacteraceae bacterium]
MTVTVLARPLGRDIHVRISPELPDLPDALLAQLIGAISSSIPISPADRLRAIHERSNLTWSQLARLFGVSRRAVHAWVGGSRMSAANLERLGRVEQFVSACYEATPQATRDRLFSSPPGQLSPFATLLAEISEARPSSEPRAWAERNDVGGD